MLLLHSKMVSDRWHIGHIDLKLLQCIEAGTADVAVENLKTYLIAN